MKTGVPVEKKVLGANERTNNRVQFLLLSSLSLTGCIILGEFNKESVDRWEIATLGQGWIWGVQTSIGYQNSTELGLVYASVPFRENRGKRFFGSALPVTRL